jgi:hypothetical protein
MKRNVFIGILFLVIVLQSLALGWLIYRQRFSPESAWNRYWAGERLLYEAEVSGSPEQISSGIALMDQAHRELLVAGEIVPLFVPQGSDLERIIRNLGIRNLLNGTQGSGGQRPASRDGEFMQVDVRMLRRLQKFSPQALPQQ